MSKTTYILAFLLVGQTVMIAARELGGSKATGAATGKTAVFPGLTLEQVARVKIAERDGAAIELARGDKGWVVASAGGYPAKSDAVEKLVGKLADLQSTGVAATSASSHAAFEVSEHLYERDIRLLDASGAEKAHLYLGRAVAGGQFVRRADSGDVLRVGEPLTWQALTQPTTYIETQLVKVEQPKVKAMTLRKGSEVVVALTRDGDAWKATTPADLEVDKAKVNEMVGALSRVYAAAPVGPSKPEFGLDGPDAFTVEVEVDGGAKTGVTLGGKPATAGRRYARPIGSSMVAEVSEDAAKALEKDASFFKPTPPPAPVPAPGAEPPLSSAPVTVTPTSSGHPGK